MRRFLVILLASVFLSIPHTVEPRYKTLVPQTMSNRETRRIIRQALRDGYYFVRTNTDATHTIVYVSPHTYKASPKKQRKLVEIKQYLPQYDSLKITNKGQR